MLAKPKESPTIIFVVDDEADILEYAARFLLGENRKIRTFISPLEALSAIALEEAEPDLIVTDIMMPEMTGIEFIEKIRETMAYVPVVIMTGHADKEVAMSALELGVVGIVEKPFEPASLQEVVNKALLSSSIDQEKQKLFDGYRTALDGVTNLFDQFEKSLKSSVLLASSSENIVKDVVPTHAKTKQIIQRLEQLVIEAKKPISEITEKVAAKRG